MENKNGTGSSAGAMGGKGFYIVLLLCAAVIGVSAWILLAGVGTNVEEIESAEEVVDVSGATVTMLPAGTQTEDEEAADDTMTDTDSAEEQEAEEEEETAAYETQSVFSQSVTSYVWPVRGDIETPYAEDTLIYNATMADWRTHDGIDIACDMGEQVLAAAAGTVVSVTDEDLAGTTVEIDHANGVHTIYSNLAAEPNISVGDAVTMGQVVGSVGSTALGEANEVSHLHFAMTLDGVSVDPMDYLDEMIEE